MASGQPSAGPSGRACDTADATEMPRYYIARRSKEPPVVDEASESSRVRRGREGTVRQWRGGPSATAPGLSIVVPVHNEAASLPRLHAELAAVARALEAAHGLACEVIYVDDGRRDDTIAIITQMPAAGLDCPLVLLYSTFD